MWTLEDPIRSTAQLKRLIGGLEEDEAIRIEGKIPRFKGGGFIFVGVRAGEYQVNICDRVAGERTGTYTVGERDEWHRFHGVEEVWRFIGPFLKTPLKASIY
jgi:hypothetical protein